MATLLMNRDIPVLKFDMDDGLYQILDAIRLPFPLQNALWETPPLPADASQEALRQYMQDARRSDIHNRDCLMGYFSSRVLPLTRENAKKIYNYFGFSQSQDSFSRTRIAILCRILSLQDAFWLKDEADPVKWADVDLHHIHLSEAVAQVSLHGTSLSLQGEMPMSPETSGQGLYAKAWIREADGLYLYKLGAGESDLAAQIEVMVSKLLDKTNVSHVKYQAAETGGRFACKCRCMTTDEISILSGQDYLTYCNHNNLDRDEVMQLDPDSIYKMAIVDYLISNPDRHEMNWGLFYNTTTMQLIGCHPLYDNNQAFDPQTMQNKELAYRFDRRKSMREAAQYAVKHTDFQFIAEITRQDFLKAEYYESFQERRADLFSD